MNTRVVKVVLHMLTLSVSSALCDTHYVSTSGSNQHPYTTPETAALSIQDAIDAANPGETVSVAEGEYKESIRMKPNTTLQGAGAELTTIVYEPAERESTVLAASDAVINGFSIRGGSCGILQREQQDYPFRVVNCSISGTTNSAISAREEIIVRDCLISNNAFRGLSLWGSAFAVVSRCTFLHNTGAACNLQNYAYLILDHCTISGNGAAIGFWEFTGQVQAANSIIWGNADDALIRPTASVKTTHCAVSDRRLKGISGNLCCDPGFVGYGDFNNSDNPIHVKCNYSGPEDGTRERPFKSIAKVLGLFEYELGTESPCLGAASDGKNIGASLDFVPTRPSGSPNVLINVAPGLYQESELSLRHAEHLRGAGPELTTIDPGGRSYPYESEYVLRAGNGARIENLTIAGATWGVALSYSAPVISHCVIRNCYGGFFCYGSSAQIHRCLIRNCGEGIVWADSSDLVSYCTIVANESFAIYSWSASPARISDSILWFNGQDFHDTVTPDMVSRCNLQGPELVGVNGNISTDPLFMGWAGCGGEEATVYVNPAAAEMGDEGWNEPFRSVSEALAHLPEYSYHLAVGSPCLTAGIYGGQIGAYPDDIPWSPPVSRLCIGVTPGTTLEADMKLPPAIDLIGSRVHSSVLYGGTLFPGPSNTIRNLTVAGVQEGAGILCTTNSRSVISNCRITACEYGVHVEPADILRDCEILNNRRIGVGAGGRVSGCLIAGNGEAGVSIYGVDSAVVEHCTIADNRDVGVFIGDCSPTVRHCTILGNKCGGIATSDSSPTIDSCVLKDNGCGMILFDSEVLVLNCLVFGHRVAEPGAGWCSTPGVGLVCGGGSRIINTTVSGNFRGVTYDGWGTVELVNSIVWGNQDADIFLAGEYSSEYSNGLDVTCSNVGGRSVGSGNIDADPRFVDPEKGDFRLLPDSPCIDAGIVAESMPPHDLAGMHRVMFGGKELRPDMGAFEYYINELASVANGQAMILTWSSLSNKTYSVLYSEDATRWFTAETGLTSWGNTTTCWINSPFSGPQPPPGQVRRRYYRIVEEQ